MRTNGLHLALNLAVGRGVRGEVEANLTSRVKFEIVGGIRLRPPGEVGFPVRAALSAILNTPDVDLPWERVLPYENLERNLEPPGP